MISLERADLVVAGVQVGGHRMLTIGSERCGVRATMGSLDRHGRWHPHRSDVFLLWRERRRDFGELVWPDGMWREAPGVRAPAHHTASCWEQPGAQEWHWQCAVRHPLRFARSRGPVRWRPR